MRRSILGLILLLSIGLLGIGSYQVQEVISAAEQEAMPFGNQYSAELYDLFGVPVVALSVEAANNARILTFWVSPFEAPVNLQVALSRVKKHLPPGFKARLLVPGLYGSVWRSCRSVLCPKSVSDVANLRQQVERAGLLFGLWTLPRSLTESEGKLHGQAAAAAGFNVLDLEPYPGFLVRPSGSPVGFLKAYQQYEPRVHISIVPQPSGLTPFKGALRLWLLAATTIRPQVYFTDAPQLSPRVAIPYLERVLESFGLQRTVVLLLPGIAGSRVLSYLEQENEADIWRLLP